MTWTDERHQAAKARRALRILRWISYRSSLGNHAKRVHDGSKQWRMWPKMGGTR